MPMPFFNPARHISAEDDTLLFTGTVILKQHIPNKHTTTVHALADCVTGIKSNSNSDNCTQNTTDSSGNWKGCATYFTD